MEKLEKLGKLQIKNGEIREIVEIIYNFSNFSNFSFQNMPLRRDIPSKIIKNTPFDGISRRKLKKGPSTGFSTGSVEHPGLVMIHHQRAVLALI